MRPQQIGSRFLPSAGENGLVCTENRSALIEGGNRLTSTDHGCVGLYYLVDEQSTVFTDYSPPFQDFAPEVRIFELLSGYAESGASDKTGSGGRRRSLEVMHLDCAVQFV